MAERVAGGPTVARWESWDGTGLQHLVLRVGPEEIVVVPSAPGAASVRVWQVMSRGRDPSTGTGPKPGAPAAGGRSCYLSSEAALIRTLETLAPDVVALQEAIHLCHPGRKDPTLTEARSLGNRTPWNI